MRIFGTLLAASIILTACAAAPKLLWVRSDGQIAGSDPVLAQQLEMDRTVCTGERQKANLSGVSVYQGGLAGAIAAQDRATAADQVARGCMAEKGYVLVPEDQAEAKRQELAAIAAEKARREAAANRATTTGRKR